MHDLTAHLAAGAAEQADLIARAGRVLTKNYRQAPIVLRRGEGCKVWDVAGREYLTALLRRLAGNVTRAAIEAGMERESLHRALRTHGMDPARFRQ